MANARQCRNRHGAADAARSFHRRLWIFFRLRAVWDGDRLDCAAEAEESAGLARAVADSGAITVPAGADATNAGSQSPFSPISTNATTGPRPKPRQLHQKLEVLSLQSGLAAPRPDFVLWPELPAPVYYFEDASLRERLHNLARFVHAPLIAGTVGQTGKGGILNSAIEISPDGQLKGRYDKIFLVPFGEYIPFPVQRHGRQDREGDR